MTTYSYAQLEQLWIGAGGSKALAPVMAAIAEAESSGNSQAYNASGASGLWQILGAVNPSDQGNLFNPQVNAKEALLKYNTQGLGAWVTYTSGAYKQYLQGNVPPSALTGGGPPPGVAAPGSPNSPASGGGTTGSSSTFSTAPDGAITDAENLPVIGGLIAVVEVPLHALAVIIDYSWQIFEPGSGGRLLFGIAALILFVMAYKIFASLGAVPDLHLPRAVPVPV